jgi:hypothetical protein
LVWTALASAQNVEDRVPTPEEIKEQKTALEIKYKNDVKECYQKFAVNMCKDKAYMSHAQELAKLRKYELKNNELQRADKAQQMQSDAAKEVAKRESDLQAQKESANATYEQKMQANKEKNEQHERNMQSAGVNTKKTESSERSAISAPEADARAKYDAKQREAALHKAEVEQRLAEKAKSQQSSTSNNSAASK